MRSIFFHEDDFCQIEVLPVSNEQNCLEELGQLEEFSTAHRSPDGMGWTAVYERMDAAIPTIGLGLDMARCSDRLAASLEPFEEVLTGYGSTQTRCLRTRAFGIGPACAIFVQSTQSGLVEHVWLGLHGPSSIEQERLLGALSALDDLGPFILVDWGWGRLYRLSDKEGMAVYLEERFKVFDDLKKTFERQRAEKAEPKPWWRFFG